VADDPCTPQVEHATCEPVSVKGRLGGMLESASGQGERSQAGASGADAFIQIAILQLKVDIGGEVLQIKQAGDLGSSKPQPTRIRLDRVQPTQYVADHSRRACPPITPRPHRGVVNRLIADS
jgi:hypothetical protein